MGKAILFSVRVASDEKTAEAIYSSGQGYTYKGCKAMPSALNIGASDTTVLRHLGRGEGRGARGEGRGARGEGRGWASPENEENIVIEFRLETGKYIPKTQANPGQKTETVLEKEREKKERLKQEKKQRLKQEKKQKKQEE